MAGIEREEKRIRKKTLKGKVILETGQVIFETIHTLLQTTNPALDSFDGTPVFLTRLCFRMVRLLLLEVSIGASQKEVVFLFFSFFHFLHSIRALMAPTKMLKGILPKREAFFCHRARGSCFCELGQKQNILHPHSDYFDSGQHPYQLPAQKGGTVNKSYQSFPEQKWQPHFWRKSP